VGATKANVRNERVLERTNAVTSDPINMSVYDFIIAFFTAGVISPLEIPIILIHGFPNKGPYHKLPKIIEIIPHASTAT
jgi:hypothetical protein